MKLESSLRDQAGFLYTAPLLDMVLLLLIFFLLGSSFVLQSGISVSVPLSPASLPSVDSAHIVTVAPGPGGRIYFNEHRVTLEELRAKLEESREQTPDIRHVILRADQATGFGRVVEISNEIQQRNFQLAHATTAE